MSCLSGHMMWACLLGQDIVTGVATPPPHCAHALCSSLAHVNSLWLSQGDLTGPSVRGRQGLAPKPLYLLLCPLTDLCSGALKISEAL